MKIHFDGVDWSSQSGKDVFATRLAKAFFETGHDVLTSSDGADVSLVFESSRSLLAKKFFFRPGVLTRENINDVRTLCATANAVIFQSQFQKNLFLEENATIKNSCIITNGVKLDPIKSFKTPGLEQLRNEYKLVFSCCANWTKQKRFNDNVALFKHVKDTIERSSCLIVLGNVGAEMISDKDVFYAGNVQENFIKEVFSMSDWLIHLAWMDIAPNVVCEALSQTTPVIYSEQSGIEDITRGFGIKLKENATRKQYFERFYTVPVIDVKQLKTLPQKSELSSPSNVNIYDIAKDYIKLFESVK